MKNYLFILLFLILTLFINNSAFSDDFKITSKKSAELVEISNYCDSLLINKISIDESKFNYLKGQIKVLKNDTILYKIYVVQSNYYYYHENYEKVIDVLKIAQKISIKKGFNKYYFKINNTIGIANYQIGEYDKALNNFYKALKFANDKNNVNAKFDVYQNIAILYLKLEDFEKSKYYFNKAYELKEYITDDNVIGGLLINMANMYKYNNKQYNKALEFHKLALTYFEKANNLVGITSVYNNIGDIFEMKNDYKNAIIYYKKANKNFKEINYKSGICISYFNIASVYYLENNYTNSIINLNLSEKYADSLNYIEMKRDINKKLYEIYYKTNDYKKSIEKFKTYVLFKDSIININKMAKFHELNLIHKKSLADAEIIKLKEKSIAKQYLLLKKEKELNKQKYKTIIFSLISIIFLLIIFIIFYRYRKLNIKFTSKEKEINDTKTYLKTSEARFKILFEESPDAIFVENAEGIILDVNNASCSLYKKTKEQIIGKNIKDLSPDIEKENIITDLNYWVNRKEKTLRSFAYLVNGDKIPIDIKVSIIDFDGEKAGLFIVRDISKQVEIEEKLQAEKIKFIRADSLKSLFLSNISHEIRTPMNAIIGFSDLLRNNKLSAEKISYYSEVIINNSEILIKSIEDIIDVSKIESNSLTINISECNPKFMFKDIYEIYLPKAQARGIDLKLFIDTKLKENLNTDQYRCKQIIDNLLGNAIKFTENGKIDFGFKINNNVFEVFVNDTGIGIPKNKMQYIFDPFYQIQYEDNLNYGTGLGLPIIKRITKLLNGKLEIESKVGVGTNISCYFPLEITNQKSS